MWKQFTVQGNKVYLDILPKILEQYNNTKHSSIKITPRLTLKIELKRYSQFIKSNTLFQSFVS